jgi:phospholipid N-methyltransferase
MLTQFKGANKKESMKYKYKTQKKLLGSSTYKMEKSSKFKYLSEILHLAPSNIGGVNICASSSPICVKMCLNTSGRGQMTSVQKSRLNKKVLTTKYNIATVFRKKLPKKWLGRKVINGDKHDLRHLDPKKVVVGLIAKGKAKKDFNGFVQDV